MTLDSSFAAGQYIRFQTRAGQDIPARMFQNIFPNETRVWGGISYDFAPFVVLGNVSTRGSDSAQAQLDTVINGLTVPLINEAVVNNWAVRVETVSVARTGPDNPFTEVSSIAIQFWPIKGASFQESEDGDGEEEGRLSLRLQSAYDAVNRQWPRGVLTSDRVGYLPPTGDIFLT